ncbi:ABC transporter permease [Actinoallomurus iriomotensis]|uniref:Dipeptide-transport integral membrane protein ABC transporter DppB n=1 Tax=Actinoallomurus iriomotensis TaxID=478107 RepID=A0A9W6RCU7_9ACTN|nr:ABC transporter permease [Actinoallomurus iriomotensis]GLY73259.1 putative dipeptide-transport integral membrane protein ABC transporter DppB [Actinoallomurus iriomotensis]
MWRYVVRRLLQMVPVLIGTTLLIYLAVFALPGDPIRVLGGDKPMSPAVYQALRHHYHLDDPLIVQYGKYLWGLVRGDFGETLNGQPVGDVLTGGWTVTVQLAVTAWVFELVVGIALGVWAGLRKGGVIDTLVLSGTTLVIAIPGFVLAYSAQLLFGLKLGWFPTAGTDDGWPYSYLLPGILLGSLSLAYIARLTRTSLVENGRSDYVRTAVAKGLSRRRVLVRHTLRNSLIPVVTYLGVDLGNLMAGAIIIEGIFNLPGIGQQIWLAIQVKDGPTVVGISTFLVLIYLLANLVVDFLYGVLDPRIRHD